MKTLILVLITSLMLSASAVFGCGGPNDNCVSANPEETAEIPDWVFGDARLTASQKTQAIREARAQVKKLKAGLSDGKHATLAKYGDAAIAQLVKRGIEKLNEAGANEEAYFYSFQFRTEYEGYLTRMVASRDIGDHPTMILSQWIEDFYNKLEFILGVAACKALHLSDLMTINRTTKIVFAPCSFPMDAVTIERIAEYRNHFSQGAVYYGFVPVISWWITDISLMMTPAALFAGAIASAVEYLMGAFVAPKISDFVWGKACTAW